ncbi:MAG: 16S rRNA (uracil(1498)-N(3))-methyltransferase [Alphaproteobacteria bacterium]|nr:16S rRNA (uracil(1498)-N(3))-methyltransferase [Alphaproteobacteria bacterium]
MADELTEAGGRIRLYVTADLAKDTSVTLSDGQGHYLLHVMRAEVGDCLRLFNGRDGEWAGEIMSAGKRGVTVTARARTAPQVEVPDLWLCFAPVKKTPSDYLAQKATELGVAKLQPVFTRRTIVTRVNQDRLLANVIEAAEQSDRLSVPEVAAPVMLEKMLSEWPEERTLYFCDEGGDACPMARVAILAPVAILTGPEGGFDPAERALLRKRSFVVPVTLGPRILRADTAALAALAVWQSTAGGWRQE